MRQQRVLHQHSTICPNHPDQRPKWTLIVHRSTQTLGFVEFQESHSIETATSRRALQSTKHTHTHMQRAHDSIRNTFDAIWRLPSLRYSNDDMRCTSKKHSIYIYTRIIHMVCGRIDRNLCALNHRVLSLLCIVRERICAVAHK